MKKKELELNVDFIGGQGPLTQEEQLAVSKFIEREKSKRKAEKYSRKRPLSKRKQVSV